MYRPVHPATGRIARLCLSAVVLALLLLHGVRTSAAAGVSQETCSEAGRWVDPATGAIVSADKMLSRLSGRAVVLLGEIHTAREDHLWQAFTLAGLHAYRPKLAIGFEMFPRSEQPVLDRWSRGGLSQNDFLREVHWREVWGYDPALYMPLFDFSRQNRLPIFALNVDRELVARVGHDGWASVPADAREGVGNPAPASDAYRRSLAKVFRLKRSRHAHGASGGETDLPKDLDAVMARKDFAHFVEAQLTWDRAMAEAIAAAKTAHPDTLVVGILGRGHVEYRYGVPHQLSDLGIDDVAVLLPIETGEDCESLPDGIADTVFLVDPEENTAPAAPKPMLGVVIETAEDGVRILKVANDSVAQAAALTAGDIVLEAAGVPVRRYTELAQIVRRQAPGTWLPLRIRRGEKEMSVVAKFPPAPGADE